MSLHKHPRASLPATWTEAEAATTARIANALRSCGYDRASMGDVLGLEPIALAAVTDPVVARHLAARRDDDLGALVRTFMLSEPCPADKLTRLLGAGAIADLQLLGLVRTLEDGRVQVLAQVVAWDERMLVFGDPEFGLDQDERDTALVVTPSTRFAYELTVRPRGSRALDIGTGTGVHAIAAAAHCDVVVATDPNERALVYARMNAAANDVADRVDVRGGSLFESVPERDFDLIVANLPFTISPPDGERSLYVDSGVPADELCQRAVEEAATHLADGGHACMMISWPCPPGDQLAPLARWLDGASCDVVVLVSDVSTPLEHARYWNRGHHADQASWEQALTRWVGHLAERGIEEIAQGCIVLRRRTDGENWLQQVQLGGSVLQPLGDQVLDIFRARDAVRRAPAALLDGTLVLAPGCSIDRRHVVIDDAPHLIAATIHRSGQPAVAVELGEFELMLIDGMIEGHAILELLAETCDALGVEPAAVFEPAAQLMRRLVDHGLAVVPEEPPAGSTADMHASAIQQVHG